MSGGGGAPEAETHPRWLFEESTGIMESWVRSRHKHLQDGLGSRPGTTQKDVEQEGLELGDDYFIDNDVPGAGSYDLNRALIESIKGATPFTGMFAFDPDPSELDDPTWKNRLFPIVFDYLNALRVAGTDRLLHSEHDGSVYFYGGPGNVLSKMKDDLATMIESLISDDPVGGSALFSGDHYDVSALVTGIIAEAITRADSETDAAIIRAQSYTQDSVENAAIRSASKLAYEGAESKILVDTGLEDASLRTGMEKIEELADGAVDGTDYAVDAIALAEKGTGDFVSNAIDASRDHAEADVNAGIAVLCDSVTGLQSAITAALSAATTAASSTLVDAAVGAFEDQGLPEHIRRVNRLAGTMVDINAVHGSAFILGMGLLERQHQRDVASFRAQLSTELYIRAFEAFKDMFSRTLDLYLSELKEKVNNRMQMFQTVLSERTRTFLTTFASGVDVFARMAATYQDYEKTFLGEKIGMGSAILQSHKDFAAQYGVDYMRNAVNARLDRLGKRDAFSGQLTDSMMRVLQLGFNVESMADQNILDLQWKRYAANTAVLDKAIEFDAHDKVWRFDVIGRGVNYLGTPAGVAVGEPKPYTYQIIGGMLGPAGKAAEGAGALISAL